MERTRAVLDDLVDQGVLTREQSNVVAAALAAPQPQDRRVSPMAEVVGYIGGVLATVAAITVASQFWSELHTWAQLGIFALVAVAMWLAGRSVREVDDLAAGRLGGTLWFLSTAATAALAWIAGDRLLNFEWRQATMLMGAIATVHAGALWWVRRGALQQIALFAGVVTTAMAALALLPSPPDDMYGLAVWALGIAWLALAWSRVVAPLRTGLALGAVTAVIGAEMFAMEGDTLGLVLLLATVAGLFAAAAVTRQALLVGIASVSLAVALPQALAEWFPDSISAPTAVFVAGIILLGGALGTIRAARRSDSVSATP